MAVTLRVSTDPVIAWQMGWDEGSLHIKLLMSQCKSDEKKGERNSNFNSQYIKVVQESLVSPYHDYWLTGCRLWEYHYLPLYMKYTL